MAVLPVVGSLVSPTALGKFIADVWTIPLRSCLLLNVNINDHYVIETDAATYIARLYGSARGGPQDVAFELGFAEHAFQQGARVSSPLPQPDGSFCAIVGAPEGPRVVAVWAAARGRPSTLDDALAYGRQVALLHQAGDSYEPAPERRPLDSDYLVRNRALSIEGMFDDESSRSAARQLAEEVAVLLDASLAAGVDWGPCHGDTHGGNAHVDDDGPMLFDMEFAGPGPRAYDLATFNWSVARSKRQETDAWTNFLSGYATIRPVPNLELVPVLAAARCMWLLGHWAGAETLEPNSTW